MCYTVILLLRLKRFTAWNGQTITELSLMINLNLSIDRFNHQLLRHA